MAGLEAASAPSAPSLLPEAERGCWTSTSCSTRRRRRLSMTTRFTPLCTKPCDPWLWNTRRSWDGADQSAGVVRTCINAVAGRAEMPHADHTVLKCRQRLGRPALDGTGNAGLQVCGARRTGLRRPLRCRSRRKHQRQEQPRPNPRDSSVASNPCVLPRRRRSPQAKPHEPVHEARHPKRERHRRPVAHMLLDGRKVGAGLSNINRGTGFRP